jgi:L-aspartate oxidase
LSRSNLKKPLVIVGSGIAGLWTALQAAPIPVLLLSEAELGAGSATGWAQGGIAAALGEDDSSELHARDTIAAGAGLVDEEVARLVTELGPAEVRALEATGVAFDHAPDGRWMLSHEAAHVRRRVARVSGDRAGVAILQALVAAVHSADHIQVREHVSAQGLMADDNGRCCGVTVQTAGGDRDRIGAAAVVLATGGLGGLYALTTNPIGNRGRALAWAARLGAIIRDAEFVQFHPTAIATDQNPTWLATEALRGEGAILVDRDGRRFMTGIHPDADLAPRDIVARAVFRQLQSGRGAWLDGTQAIGAAFPERFPFVFKACSRLGIDPRRQPIPVAPAAHYQMGGIATDLDGRTSVEGLFAVGECACIGLHGANRLASNSLLEALVIGRRVAAAIDRVDRSVRLVSGDKPGSSLVLPDPALDDLRQAMSRHAGVERDGPGLQQLIDRIDALASQFGLTDELITARLVARSALARRESRGAHYRRDFPDTMSPPQSTRMDLATAFSDDPGTEGNYINRV